MIFSALRDFFSLSWLKAKPSTPIPMSPLASTYAKQYRECEIRPEKREAVQAEAARIKAQEKRYRAVAANFDALPWWVVGIIHSLECGLRFDQHLHNGDPLKARTVQVPKGRPKDGKPPFTWEESAIDAIECDKLDLCRDWTPGSALENFENYNGTGYRHKGVPSPYLWSFTDQYRSGKYTADGKYDPQAVSKQVGCAALMKALGI